MMCAHGHGGSCKGDSGGPLVCGNTAVGVTSFGDPLQCNSPKGEKLTVVVGAHDLKNGSSRMDVKFYHIHPGFESKSLLNDIMLLQLHVKVKTSKKVNWISIPKKDKDIKANAKCSVAGWGKKTTSGTASAKLMEVDVTIIDKKACQKYWGKTYSTSRMVCAGGRGGFCQGDSGGPLVCNKVAVGVVSFNEKNNCDSPTLPNVYTKISKFLPWINCIFGGTFGADIINGKKVKKNSMLYMASVQIDGKHRCGGFLIDPSYVMTAAHCDDRDNMTVILGTHNISPQQENLRRYTVQHKHKHPSFRHPKTGHDIMLLKLSQKLKIGRDVKTIEIPNKIPKKPLKPNSKCQVAGWGKTKQQDVVNDLLVTDVSTINFTTCQTMLKKMEDPLPDNVLCSRGSKTKSCASQLSKKLKTSRGVKTIKIPNKPLKPNSKCQVAGWGKTEQHNVVNDLLVTDVSTINFTTCQTMWKKLRVKLPDNVLCAGSFKTKSCASQGDFGGPLVCSGKAVGIVSLERCDSPNVPNIYTQISKYAVWIKKVINGEYVKTIEIPNKIPKKTLKPNSKCQVAGWGKTEQHNVVNDLLVTDVSTINFTTCQTMLKKLRVKLPDNVLCSRGSKTKSCASQGDSGGPLVCSGKAVGIVSLECCDNQNVSNIYTQISKYTAWIKKVINGGA
ncbi:Granzyme-like protein 1 [Anabarilius grahami]|uniref:trypsin n=1 Tax=Anabarilius grahami TaxID=495550 RepID=A0A3N0Y3Q7_ANAGA|nr:Granzyme-like protein 1 [Anabarilius grahami]